MFSVDACKQRYLKQLNKTYDQLSVREKAIFADVCDDNARGRYPRVFLWSTVERNKFYKYIEDLGLDIVEMEPSERWAYEDAFTDSIHG